VITRYGDGLYNLHLVVEKPTELTTMATELKINRKLFPDHLPSVFHGAMVGAKFPLAHYELQKALKIVAK
jgi:hypothetical protein